MNADYTGGSATSRPLTAPVSRACASPAPAAPPATAPHNPPTFTLATYVHLMEEDMPEPPDLATVVLARCDHLATTTGRKRAESRGGGSSR